jgi:hypothetical protein
MARKSGRLAFFALVTWVSSACADSGILDLIPGDAAAAVGIRNLNDLNKKGDQLIADTKMTVPLRPSQAFDFVVKFLGINAGIDSERPAAVILAHPRHIHRATLREQVDDLLVVAIPFTDRDKIAANFGLPAGDLKPDQVRSLKAGRMFGKKIYVHGAHLYLGNDERVITGVIQGSPVSKSLSTAQQRRLADADVFLHLGPQSWGGDWKEFLKQFQTEVLKEQPEESERQAVHEFFESLASIRFGLATLRVERGLGFSFLAAWPPEQNKPAQDFLTMLRAGPGAADFIGLPEGSVVAAQAARGDGTQNAPFIRVFLNALARTMAPGPTWPSHRLSTLLGVTDEVWGRLRGSRSALYRNAQGSTHGLFSLVAILDTADAEEFLNTLRGLVRLADPASLNLSPKAGRKQDIAEVERLVQDLGDRRFRTRVSATTKLSLIGEPALPHLETALTSSDVEVRRRAQTLKERIVQAAVERRKELLSKDGARVAHPTFAYAVRAETRGGQPIDILQVRLGEKDAKAADSFRQLFGSQWDQVRLAPHGKQVVVYWGSDPQFLDATLKNLKGGKLGLAEASALAQFAPHRDPGRKLEFRVSLETIRGLRKAEDLKQGTKLVSGCALSATALTVEPDRLQLDLWLPASEVKSLVAELWAR